MVDVRTKTKPGIAPISISSGLTTDAFQTATMLANFFENISIPGNCRSMNGLTYNIPSETIIAVLFVPHGLSQVDEITQSLLTNCCSELVQSFHDPKVCTTEAEVQRNIIQI